MLRSAPSTYWGPAMQVFRQTCHDPSGRYARRLKRWLQEAHPIPNCPALSLGTLASKRLVLDPRLAISLDEITLLLHLLSAQFGGAWVACEGFLPGATLMLSTAWRVEHDYDTLVRLAGSVLAPVHAWVEDSSVQPRSLWIDQTALVWRKAPCRWMLVADFTVLRVWPWELSRPRAY